MSRLANIYDCDDNEIIDSDWQDMDAMIDDIKLYVNSTYELINNADDIGNNNIPISSPRIGFVSQSGKRWTIKVINIKYSTNDPKRIMLKSTLGRQKLLDFLNEKSEVSL